MFFTCVKVGWHTSFYRKEKSDGAANYWGQVCQIRVEMKASRTVDLQEQGRAGFKAREFRF